jgi:hypothetical protein
MPDLFATVAFIGGLCADAASLDGDVTAAIL